MWKKSKEDLRKKKIIIKPAGSKNFYMRTGLESSARRFTQRHCGEVTRPIMSPQGEGRGLSQTLRASVPLDRGPRAAVWHCLYLALVIYSSSVILLSTCLCHFLNHITNGLQLRLFLHSAEGLLWLARHLQSDSWALNFLNQIDGEASEYRILVLLWEAARETQSKHQSIEISKTFKDLGAECTNDLNWAF